MAARWRTTRRASCTNTGMRQRWAQHAAHLARLLRLGEITEVRVPDREIEAVRDLVRAREDARADLMRVRHLLSKLLLRQGIVYYGGTPWTCVHEQWLRRQRFDDVHLKAAFDYGLDAVLAASAARDRLDEQIVEVAASRGSPTRSTGWAAYAASRAKPPKPPPMTPTRMFEYYGP
jgi:transposase